MATWSFQASSSAVCQGVSVLGKRNLIWQPFWKHCQAGLGTGAPPKDHKGEAGRSKWLPPEPGSNLKHWLIKRRLNKHQWIIQYSLYSKKWSFPLCNKYDKYGGLRTYLRFIISLSTVFCMSSREELRLEGCEAVGDNKDVTGNGDNGKGLNGDVAATWAAAAINGEWVQA